MVVDSFFVGFLDVDGWLVLRLSPEVVRLTRHVVSEPSSRDYLPNSGTWCLWTPAPHAFALPSYDCCRPILCRPNIRESYFG